MKLKKTKNWIIAYSSPSSRPIRSFQKGWLIATLRLPIMSIKGTCLEVGLGGVQFGAIYLQQSKAKGQSKKR
jgi:hypothetical protein